MHVDREYVDGLVLKRPREFDPIREGARGGKIAIDRASN
jgi:hypothetical protein